MEKPLCIDLYCGLFGWGEAFLDEGYDVIGFDIEYRPCPAIERGAQLVLQDARTLHGSQFKRAAIIVCSPPCQKYSYMAMPWGRSKREIHWQEWERDSPFGDFHLNDLFDACFRIQREASEAAGHEIPMVVENVKGAQKWVGRARWHYGSFYLWGDVPALMPFSGGHRKVPGMNFHEHEKTGMPGRSFQSAAVESMKNSGVKGAAPIGPPSGGNGTGSTSWFGTSRADPRDMRKNEDGEYTRMGREDGTKQGGNWWHDPASITCRHSSRSAARKAASAAIAKIPPDLAQHIARTFKPVGV